MLPTSQFFTRGNLGPSGGRVSGGLLGTGECVSFWMNPRPHRQHQYSHWFAAVLHFFSPHDNPGRWAVSASHSQRRDQAGGSEATQAALALSIHSPPPQLGVTRVAVLSPRAPGPRLGPHPPAGPTSPLLNIGCPTPPSCSELCLEGVEPVPSRDSQPRFPSSLTPLLTVAIV